MINLERQLPVLGLEDVYVSVIHQANLGAMAGRAKSTIAGHIMALGHLVRNYVLIRKTLTIEARGPMPIGNLTGMGVTVDMIR